jgi:multidrug resistance efflux pump
VRVFKYTVPIVSQVRGRVIEVPVEEGNRLVKTGDVLFRVDPTPYQLTVNSLKAQLVGAEGGSEQLREQLKSATGATGALRARIELARKRVQQNQGTRRHGRWQQVRPRAGGSRPARPRGAARHIHRQ